MCKLFNFNRLQTYIIEVSFGLSVAMKIIAVVTVQLELLLLSSLNANGSVAVQFREVNCIPNNRINMFLFFFFFRLVAFCLFFFWNL